MHGETRRGPLPDLPERSLPDPNPRTELPPVKRAEKSLEVGLTLRIPQSNRIAQSILVRFLLLLIID